MGKRNQLRIIGGKWRGRQLRFPPATDLRPTADRIRETLFNWLGQSLDGKTCLDLFAGSGALGIEAASRGAAHVVLVEHERVACALMRESINKLDAANVEIRFQDAMAFLTSDSREFDVVFLDPPYRMGTLPDILDRLRSHLSPGAMVYLEAGQLPDIPPGYEIVRQSHAGRVRFLLLEFAE